MTEGQAEPVATHDLPAESTDHDVVPRTTDQQGQTSPIPEEEATANKSPEPPASETELAKETTTLPAEGTTSTESAPGPLPPPAPVPESTQLPLKRIPAETSPPTTDSSPGDRGPGGGPDLKQEATMSLPRMVEQSKESVVKVECFRGNKLFAGGSGFFVGGKNLIATNRHVVEGADSVKIELFDGTRVEVAGYVSAPDSRDLIILRPMLPPGKRVKSLQLAEAFPEVGQSIVALGHPVGYSYTVSRGIVSAWRNGREVNGIVRAKVFADADRVLQTDASISDGSSGGPLLDETGVVVAMTCAGDRRGQNINLCIPSTYIGQALAAASLSAKPLRSLQKTDLSGLTKPTMPGNKRYSAAQIERKITEIKSRCTCGQCKGDGLRRVRTVVGYKEGAWGRIPVYQTSSVYCSACLATGLRVQSVTYDLLCDLAEYTVFAESGANQTEQLAIAAAKEKARKMFSEVAVDRDVMAKMFSSRTVKVLANAGALKGAPVVFYGHVRGVYHEGMTKHYLIQVYDSGIYVEAIRPGWATAVVGDVCMIGGVAMGTMLRTDARGNTFQRPLIHAAAAECIRIDR